MMGFFEDVVIGEERRLGAHAFTKEAIIAFARRYDPQRFHVDEEAAKDSIFGGLCASGWHTAAAGDAGDRRSSHEEFGGARPRGARRCRRSAFRPGVENLRWTTPVRPGDVVTFFARHRQARDQAAGMGPGVHAHHGASTRRAERRSRWTTARSSGGAADPAGPRASSSRCSGPRVPRAFATNCSVRKERAGRARSQGVTAPAARTPRTARRSRAKHARPAG